jgi:transcriptional regulator with XRE-family HTH domain
MKLRVLREWFGKSQNQFAEELGVSRNTISQIEIGNQKPTLELISRIHRTYRIDINYFFIPEYNIKTIDKASCKSNRSNMIVLEADTSEKIRNEIRMNVETISLVKERMEQLLFLLSQGQNAG